MKVIQSISEIAVHGLSNNSGVKVRRDGHPGAVVEQEEGVEHDMKGVNGELVFPLHPVHEFKFDRMCFVVPQGY